MAVELDFAGDALWLLYSLIAIGVCDILMKMGGWFPEKKSNTRYFSLHVLVNAYVSITAFKDVVASYSDPSNAYAGPCDTKPAIVVCALHLYHIIFFQPLPVVDWVHHVVMVLFMLPLAYLLAPGHLLNHGAFYVSGFPGGLDYAMLVAVKKEWMASITEKKYNTQIQLWIRAPGCLMHVALTWLNFLVGLDRKNNGETVYFEHSVRPAIPDEWILFSVLVVMITFFLERALFS